jgi:hypothetical protein
VGVVFALLIGWDGLKVAHAANGEVSVQPGAGLTCVGDKCQADLGAEFHLRGNVDTLGDMAEYSGFQMRIDWDVGLTLKDVSPNTGDTGGGWPQCQTPLSAFELATTSLVGCEGAASMYTGFVTDWTMNCSATPGTFTVTMPVGLGLNSIILDPLGIPVVPKSGTGLTINCGEPIPGVGGIAELPNVAETPLEAPGSSESNAGVLAGIVAAVAAGTVALSGAAWYGRKRWLG